MDTHIAICNEYGNVVIGKENLPSRYAHIRGKRLGPICGKVAIKYAKAVVGFKGTTRYGYSPVYDGVVVTAHSAPRLIEAVKERDERASIRNARRQKKADNLYAESRAAFRQHLIVELTEEFPQLSAETIQALVDTEKTVYSPDRIGYQYGLATKTYWKQLGFNVTGKPNGIVVKGKRLFDTYSSDRLVPRGSRMTVNRLKAKWLARFGDEQLVLGQAIRLANRLQRVKQVRSFYDLKDRWIEAHQDQLTEGRIARVETRPCWGCDGSGSDGWCDRCDGTGIYSSRTLYEHCFKIADQRFVFHSYVRPKALSEERAEDMKSYGRPFTADELPCPPQSVIVSLIEAMMKE